MKRKMAPNTTLQKNTFFEESNVEFFKAGDILLLLRIKNNATDLF